MEWQNHNAMGGFPNSIPNIAPPTDEYSVAGQYAPNGQAYYGYNEDDGGIDEDDEYYFQMQDAAEERERALAAGYGANAS
jgi:hypothetical protein